MCVAVDRIIQLTQLSDSAFRLTTRLLNAHFYPRNAMRKRCLCCLSVCPSVTLVDCIHTAEDIVKLLVRPGRPIITLVC